jgi:hypothetical protein
MPEKVDGGEGWGEGEPSCHGSRVPLIRSPSSAPGRPNPLPTDCATNHGLRRGEGAGTKRRTSGGRDPLRVSQAALAGYQRSKTPKGAWRRRSPKPGNMGRPPGSREEGAGYPGFADSPGANMGCPSGSEKRWTLPVSRSGDFVPGAGGTPAVPAQTGTSSPVTASCAVPSPGGKPPGYR